MALYYRIISFGEPKGPWRARKSQATQDAINAGLAERDEWGDVYLEGTAAIEWVREDDVRLRA